MPKTKPLPDLCQYDKAECPPKKGRASKDKRHFCRGKVGVRHKVKWEKRPASYDIKNLTCVVCGKVLDWHFKPWQNRYEEFAEYTARCTRAWLDKQAEAKRRLAWYLEFVD